MRHLKLVTVVLLAVTAFALVGCSKKSNPVAPPAPTPTSRVMVVHASPNAPAVDLLVDGTVRLISSNVDSDIYQNLGNRRDHQVIGDY